MSPDAYLFLTEPVKITASKKSHPGLEGRLVMASGTKKKNLNNYAISGYPHNFVGDMLPPSSTFIENDKVSTSESDFIDDDNQEFSSVDEPVEDIAEEISDYETTTSTDDPFVIVDDEEMSDKIASEIADEIIKELEAQSPPENFLTNDGKTLITLHEYSTGDYKDDSENVLVTSTFSSDITDVDEFGKEITSTSPTINSIDDIETSDKSSIRVNRYIESPRKTQQNSINSVDNKPSVLNANINVEKFFKDLREKWEKGIPSLAIKKETEALDVETTEHTIFETNEIDAVTDDSVNVYEFLTTVSNFYGSDIETTENYEDEKDIISTTEYPSEYSAATTFDPRFHFLDDDQEDDLTTTTEIISTTPDSAMVPSTIETRETLTTTPIPLKTHKSPKKKKSSSDTLNFFKEFTQEDIDVLKSLFRSAKSKKSPINRRTKEKRSHPDEFWNDLLKKASPRLKALGKLVGTEETTTIPETTTILSTTPDALLQTTLRTTPIQTTTIVPESLADYIDQNRDTQEAREQETNDNRIDDTLHSKRAAQNSIFSADAPSPFSNLREKFNMGSQLSNHVQPLPTMKETNFKKPVWVEKLENETSEEREYRLEHDLQKMIKFVGILSKIDGFFMGRTKSAVKKLSSLLDDDDGDSQRHRHHDRKRKRRNQLYY